MLIDIREGINWLTCLMLTMLECVIHSSVHLSLHNSRIYFQAFSSSWLFLIHMHRQQCTCGLEHCHSSCFVGQILRPVLISPHMILSAINDRNSAPVCFISVCSPRYDDFLKVHSQSLKYWLFWTTIHLLFSIAIWTLNRWFWRFSSKLFQLQEFQNSEIKKKY